MSAVDQDWISDGQVTVTDGVVSHLDSDLLPDGAFSWARNITTSSGKPSSRWRYREMGILPGGMFNGCSYFSKGGGMIVGSTDGQLWTVDFTSGMRLRHLPRGRRNHMLKKAYFCETAESMVINNDSGTPIIFTGNQTRLASKSEVPRGGPMAYGNGRLWVARGNVVYPGDIVQYNNYQSELQFTEIDYWAGGGAYRMPGEITGLAFIPLSDSSTGFGSLLVFGENWTNAIRAEIFDRQQWATTSGFVTQVFPNIGCINHSTIETVNQDVYWRDQHGELRSFRQAVLDYQTAGSTPISADIHRLFGYETDSLVRESSTIYFRNRLIGTTSAYRRLDSTVFRDLYTLDFVPQSSMGRKGNPLYEGEWDGHNWVQLVSGKFQGRARAFGVILTSDGNYRLVEILPESGYDEIVSNGAIKQVTPVSEIEYRSFSFQNRFVYKKLMACDLYLSGLSGDTSIKIYFRPDSAKGWSLWDSYEIKITEPGTVHPDEVLTDHKGIEITDSSGEVITTSPLGESSPVDEYLDQYRVRIRTLSPEEIAEGNVDRYNYFGYAFQVKVEITAPTWTLERMQLHAKPWKESPFAERDSIVMSEFASLGTPGTGDNYSIASGEIEEFWEMEEGQVYESERGVKYHVAG